MGARSAYVWPIGTAVVVLVLSAYLFVTDAENRPYTLAGPLLVGFLVLLVVRSKQWLEVSADDVVLVQRRAFTTVRVGLKDARELYLRANGGGTAQVVAKAADGRTAFGGVLMISTYAEGYQPAEVLEALLQGAARNRTKGAGRHGRGAAPPARARAGGRTREDRAAGRLRQDCTGIIGAAGPRARPAGCPTSSRPGRSPGAARGAGRQGAGWCRSRKTCMHGLEAHRGLVATMPQVRHQTRRCPARHRSAPARRPRPWEQRDARAARARSTSARSGTKVPVRPDDGLLRREAGTRTVASDSVMTPGTRLE
jgi:hypothetical protein